MNVPETILHQLRCGVDAYGNTGTIMMMCWGVDNISGSNDESDGG